MRILVTGADGFIGKNLCLHLSENKDFEVIKFVRGDSEEALFTSVLKSDLIVHLAGENRPKDPSAFAEVNTGLTRTICRAIKESTKKIPVLFSSSTQAELDNPYGTSKFAAEQLLTDLARENTNPVAIYRLPGVFGKWCKPNYNSVVATFCHNIALNLPIQINDPQKSLQLVYVDDVVESILRWIKLPSLGLTHPTINPEYQITLGELASQIESFKNCRSSLISERVGTGLTRALYATYVSYLPKNSFVYDIPAHGDARGVFVEMLKTPDSGQFSFFTAHPGITRGGHYHHTKTEKFLVIKGKARFGFRHMLTNEIYHLETSGDKPQIVETVPGWTHDITNISTEEMVVMLWANEIFDRDRPDTIACKV
jgi:UDP-2-acetamido-2,6-beta-L-arabino-hexul-4-ose reductase